MFRFERHRIDKILRERVIAQLLKVAEATQYHEFRQKDFEALADISRHPVIATFGSWPAALHELREILRLQGKDLKPRSRARIPDADLFQEMRRVWSALRHRPSRYEWESAFPKYSYETYKNRFGGWQSACLQFLEHQMGEEIQLVEESPSSMNPSHTNDSDVPERVIRRRNVPLNLRLNVLKRDGFRCVLCGRSPAIEHGVVLHLDHVHPFSMGGESTADNLRTLCEACNLGKSARTDV
jgi:hypothetical protein